MKRFYRVLFGWLLSGAVVTALLAVPGAPVYAASTITVTNLNDSGAGSLRAALASAGSGDTIALTGLSGTITLTSGELAVATSVTISGPGAATLAISGGDTSRVFNIAAPSIVEIDHLTITHGHDTFEGGGIFAAPGSYLTLDHVVVSNNTLGSASDGASHNGAGIAAASAALIIQNSQISHNWLPIPSAGHPSYGAGIFGGSPLTIDSSTIDGNTGASVPGGGVPYGIGVFAGGPTTTMSINRTTFSNNTGGFYGGGFYASGGTLSITNSTFSGNSADYGGALRIDGGVTASFNNVTIAKNTSADAAIYIIPDSTLSLRNSILADDLRACEGSTGVVTSLGNNIIENDFYCSITLLGTDSSSDPALGPLANNGGPTQTMLLLAASPAIDHGSNATCVSAVDQRGNTRPFDGDGDLTATCDIGALELEAATTTTITGDSPDPSALGQAVNVTVTVSSPVGTPAGSVSITGASTNCTITLSAGTGSCSANFSTGGAKTLVATYLGDGAHEVSADGEPHVVPFQKTLYSQGAYDGWTLESSETSRLGGAGDATGTTFFVGDDILNRQYRGLLSFNTATLPDSGLTIKSVIIKIRRQGFVGTNPFTTHQGLLVDIRKPFFGTAVGLENADFQAPVSKMSIGTFGATPASGGWYSVTLRALAYSFINLTGTTQFRLAFQLDDNNDLGADYAKFYSGNTATLTDRPTLSITYTVP